MTHQTVWLTYGDVDIREAPVDNVDGLAKFVLECQADEVALHPNYKDEINEIFEDFYKRILKQQQSLVAVDRETDELIGVLLCLLVTDYMRTWVDVMVHIENPNLKYIMNLVMLMVKESHKLQKNIKSMDSLHVFHIAIPKRNKGFNWKPRLLNGATRMGATCKLPYLTYLAYTMNDQVRALRAGMKEQQRIYYNTYVDEESGVRPFNLTNKKELCVILYKKRLTAPIPYYLIKDICILPKKWKSSRRYYLKEEEDSSENELH